MHEARALIRRPIEPEPLAARAHGSKGASPLSGLALKRRLKEWCRPPGALPSRMRDRGGDLVPPDVRFAGKACCDESSALEAGATV